MEKVKKFCDSKDNLPNSDDDDENLCLLVTSISYVRMAECACKTFGITMHVINAWIVFI